MVAALNPAWTRIIIKVGSSLLVDEAGGVKRRWLETLVDDIAALKAAGRQPVIVSSGAIALGARKLGLPKAGRASLEDAQAAAATGQIALSHCWTDLLEAQGLIAAQMLVTLDDLEDRRRYLNAAATLERLIGLGVVPVINENDSVATAEIRFGDNDRLAARIAQSCAANLLILLSDVDGLYTADPSVDPDARRIETVRRIDARIAAMASGNTRSGMGSGGMISKLEAARIANAAGSAMVIVSGTHTHPVERLAAGGCGTLFEPMANRRARKAWLAGRLTSRGTVIVDEGAIGALRRGASLLPAGALGTTGRFERGDVLTICDANGAVIGRGLAEYGSVDAEAICGKRSEALADILGYAPRSALIHRDHLVLL